MTPFVFVPLATSLGIVVLVHLLKLGGVKHADELSRSGVYVVAKGVKIFTLCAAVGLALLPFVLGADFGPSNYLLTLLIDTLMAVSCLYVYRFRLELKVTSFLYRAFRLKDISYSSVSELRWLYSGRGNRYLMAILDTKKGRQNFRCSAEAR